MRIPAWTAPLVAFSIACVTRVAHACPVCFSTKDEVQRQAFFDTTIFLTLFPLALIGGFIYWAARRVRRLDAEQPAPEARGAEPGRAGR